MSSDTGQLLPQPPRAAVSPQDAARAHERAEQLAGVAVTLLLHGLIAGLVVLGTWHKTERMEEQLAPKLLEFEDVELLALGEPKPKHQLDRLSNPPPPQETPDVVPASPPPKDAVVLDRPDKPPKDSPPPKPKDEKQARQDAMLDALSSLHDPERPVNTDLPDGHAQGVAGGKLSDAALANLMGTYAAKLKGAILSHRSAPTTLSEEQIKALDRTIAVYIRLSREGHIVSYAWRKRSGDDLFDESIETTLKKFMVQYGGRQLPVPDDAQVLQAVLEQGLLFTGQ